VLRILGETHNRLLAYLPFLGSSGFLVADLGLRSASQT
jgi:hypothetical protein